MFSRSILTSASLVLLASLVTSCSSEPTPEATSSPSATPSAAASPQSKAATFKNSLLPPLPDRAAQVPGLINGTNPGQRTAEIVKGRSNPFSPTETGKVEVIIKSARSTPQVPPVPGSRSALGLPAPGTTAIGSNGVAIVPVAPARPTVAVAPRSLPLPALNPPIADSQPTAPIASPTELAEAIQVTGVVELGSTLTAIVKSPGEATSRTVRVGDSLEGGQVIVRRIEMRGNQQPQITFSQNGVEVTRTVTGAA